MKDTVKLTLWANHNDDTMGIWFNHGDGKDTLYAEYDQTEFSRIEQNTFHYVITDCVFDRLHARVIWKELFDKGWEHLEEQVDLGSMEPDKQYVSGGIGFWGRKEHSFDNL